jgi:signal transduction histidine kinase
LNKVIDSVLREIDGLGSLLHAYCSPTHSQNLNFEITDLAKVVEEVMALQNLACQAAGIVVRFERENTLPRVSLDAPKMKQVILNLCKNASEAMPRGGHLTVKVYRSGRLVILEVSDSGVGVPDGVNVFELFKTTKPGGRGLGLPLAQQIVSAHHGAIAYTSERGHGVTFKVSLPMSESDAS